MTYTKCTRDYQARNDLMLFGRGNAPPWRTMRSSTHGVQLHLHKVSGHLKTEYFYVSPMPRFLIYRQKSEVTVHLHIPKLLTVPRQTGPYAKYASVRLRGISTSRQIALQICSSEFLHPQGVTPSMYVRGKQPCSPASK